VPWQVLDDTGRPLTPVATYLADFLVRGNTAASVRSYAYDLLRWFRWLRAIEIDWDKATSPEVKDFVLWLCAATKRRRAARTGS
ncbi:site-specific integrase, partial [Paenibacillus polymyxa]|nr:site-specific integrase [Paenibacillus polymyxa]